MEKNHFGTFWQQYVVLFYRWLLVWVLFLVFCGETHSSNLQILNIECDFKQPASISGSCTLNQKNDTIQTISVEAFIQPNATLRNVHIKFSLLRKTGSSFQTFMGLKNVSVDMCKYLSGGLESIIIDLFLHNLRKYSNVIHPCPYSGRVYVKDFVADTSLPSVNSYGIYRIELILLEHIGRINEVYLLVKAHVKIWEKSYKLG